MSKYKTTDNSFCKWHTDRNKANYISDIQNKEKLQYTLTETAIKKDLLLYRHFNKALNIVCI